MINLQRLAEERPLSLPAAADYIGKLTGQRRPNVTTLWRWCLKGCKGVKLDSICIGGKRFVTVSAIERFIEARSLPDASDVSTTAASTPPTLPHVIRHNDRRRQEIEAARRRLDELTGVKRHSSEVSAPTDATRSA
jgi:hypothetical protein